MFEAPEKLPTSNTETAKNINIGGEVFTYVKTREFAAVSIYEGRNCFLKTGPRDIIEKESGFQKRLFELGFPVSRIMNTGEEGGVFYFIEESLGKDNFQNTFSQDIEEQKIVSDEHFNQLVGITKIYANSQIKTRTECNNKERFTKYLLLDDEMNEELPDLTHRTNQAVKKALDALSVFPTVLTHGDFHPSNLFPKGVIDLEGFAYAPLGYDILTNIYATHIFSSEKNKESRKKYNFTRNQIGQYLNEIDEIFVINDLPKLSNYKDHGTGHFCDDQRGWYANSSGEFPRSED